MSQKKVKGRRVRTRTKTNLSDHFLLNPTHPFDTAIPQWDLESDIAIDARPRLFLTLDGSGYPDEYTFGGDGGHDYLTETIRISLLEEENLRTSNGEIE